MDAILAANAEDMAAAKGRISDVMLDRLALTPQRIEALARGIRDVAALPDPVGRVLSHIERCLLYTSRLLQQDQRDGEGLIYAHRSQSRHLHTGPLHRAAEHPVSYTHLVGNEAAPELMPTPAQRKYMIERIG